MRDWGVWGLRNDGWGECRMAALSLNSSALTHNSYLYYNYLETTMLIPIFIPILQILPELLSETIVWCICPLETKTQKEEEQSKPDTAGDASHTLPLQESCLLESRSISSQQSCSPHLQRIWLCIQVGFRSCWDGWENMNVDVTQPKQLG